MFLDEAMTDSSSSADEYGLHSEPASEAGDDGFCEQRVASLIRSQVHNRSISTRAASAPVTLNGSASSTVNGCTKLLNCEASTM